MSEWKDQGDGYVRRVYCDDMLDGHAHKSSEWALSLRVTPATQGEWKRVAHGAAAAELPYAQADCDAAAVAWVLIALAKRAAAWAEGIDARLAREYREACARTDAASEADEAAQTEASGAARKEAWIAQGRALDALVRGAK